MCQSEREELMMLKDTIFDVNSRDTKRKYSARILPDTINFIGQMTRKNIFTESRKWFLETRMKVQQHVLKYESI